jgi:protein transport protein SEC61 subunit gamma-like protein
VNLRELVDSWKKIFAILTKPARSEYMVVLKVTLLGLLAIGVVSFIIRVLFYTFLFPYMS